MNELTDGGFEMLRAAVNAVRQFQCKSVKVLKARLLLTFPGREAEINEAIQFWAENVRQRHPNGIPTN